MEINQDLIYTLIDKKESLLKKKGMQTNTIHTYMKSSIISILIEYRNQVKGASTLDEVEEKNFKSDLRKLISEVLHNIY